MTSQPNPSRHRFLVFTFFYVLFAMLYSILCTTCFFHFYSKLKRVLICQMHTCTGSLCVYAPAIKPHSKKAASLTCFQMAPTTNRSLVNFVRNDFGAKRRGTTIETATWRAAPSAHTVSRSSPLCPTSAATCFSSTACRPWPSSGKLQNFTRLRVPFGFLTAVLSVIDFGKLVCW
jgi:hypothetical protein